MSINDYVHHGFVVNISIQDKKNVHLTGEMTTFKVKIKNLSSKSRGGKIPVVWRYGSFDSLNLKMSNMVTLSPPLKKGEEKTFTFLITNRLEGTVMCTIPDIGDPEKFESISDKEVMKKADKSAYMVLTSYHVTDKGTYQEQKERDRELVDSIKNVVLEEMNQRIKTAISDPEFKREVAEEIVKTNGITKEPESKNTKLQHFR